MKCNSLQPNIYSTFSTQNQSKKVHKKIGHYNQIDNNLKNKIEIKEAKELDFRLNRYNFY